MWYNFHETMFPILPVLLTAALTMSCVAHATAAEPAAAHRIDLDDLKSHYGETYTLQGVVHYIRNPHDWLFSVDINGKILPVVREESNWRQSPLGLGDVISFSGTVGVSAPWPHLTLLRCSSQTILGRNPADPPTDVDPAELADGKHDFRYIRVRGTVKDLFHDPDDDHYYSILLRCGSTPVAAAYASDGRDPVSPTDLIGADVEISGLFLPQMKGDKGGRNGSYIYLSTPADIRVVKPAPFWKPARLRLILGTLIVLFICVVVWNLALRRMAERRGKALAKESLAAAQSELKAAERTRLAADLHDALSQTLSGVSMQIDAAIRNFDTNRPLAIQRLNLAARTLKFCRDELRNCLWDLRSDTLDESDLNEAVRRTLEPHLSNATLDVRIDIRREDVSERTCHTILKVIRELSVNAIRHGNATLVSISGALEDGLFHLAVRDNGTGFDPESAPGIKTGHFGLQGIQERIDTFGGTLSIDSAPGKGANVVITFKAPTA